MFLKKGQQFLFSSVFTNSGTLMSSYRDYKKLLYYEDTAPDSIFVFSYYSEKREGASL